MLQASRMNKTTRVSLCGKYREACIYSTTQHLLLMLWSNTGNRMENSIVQCKKRNTLSNVMSFLGAWQGFGEWCAVRTRKSRGAHLLFTYGETELRAQQGHLEDFTPTRASHSAPIWSQQQVGGRLGIYF